MDISGNNQKNHHKIDNNWNERKAIHFRMVQLQEESEAIRKEYDHLFNRLRELDQISSTQTLSNIPVTSKNMYDGQQEDLKVEEPSQVAEINTEKQDPDEKNKKVDMFSRIDEIMKNFKLADKKKTQEELNSLKTTQDRKSDVRNENTVTVIENLNSKSQKPNNKKSSKITTSQLLNEPPSPNSPRYKDYLIMSKLNVMKTMKTADIRNVLTENNIKFQNATVIINGLVNKYPEIYKAGHGIYKWNDVKED